MQTLNGKAAVVTGATRGVGMRLENAWAWLAAQSLSITPAVPA